MSREINTFSEDAIRKIARETFKQMRAADGNRGFYQQRTPLPWKPKALGNTFICAMAKEFLISDTTIDTTLDYGEYCAIGRPKITADIDVLDGDVTVNYNSNPFGSSPENTFVVNRDAVYEFEVHLLLDIGVSPLAGGRVTIFHNLTPGYQIGDYVITDPAYDTAFTMIGKYCGYLAAGTEMSFGIYNNTGCKLVYATQSYAGPQVKITRHDYVANTDYWGDT